MLQCCNVMLSIGPHKLQLIDSVHCQDRKYKIIKSLPNCSIRFLLRSVLQTSTGQFSQYFTWMDIIGETENGKKRREKEKFKQFEKQKPIFIRDYDLNCTIVHGMDLWMQWEQLQQNPYAHYTLHIAYSTMHAVRNPREKNSSFYYSCKSNLNEFTANRSSVSHLGMSVYVWNFEL